MKNLHMLPVNVVDLVESLNNPNIRDTERMNLLQRVEAIRDYCTLAANKFSKTPSVKKPVNKFK